MITGVVKPTTRWAASQLWRYQECPSRHACCEEVVAVQRPAGAQPRPQAVLCATCSEFVTRLPEVAR